MTPAAGGNPSSGPRSDSDRPTRRAPGIERVHDRSTHVRLRRARRVRRGPLTMACVAEAGTGPGRVAYAIGRGMGGAVRRNRARRRLRAVMSQLAPRLAGRAWLVGADPAVLDSDFDTLRAEAEAAVSRLERT